MNYPFVSIVICTYNRKNYLKDCLGSIFAQDYLKSNFEVIVVDGDSTDGTKDLVQKEFPKAKLIIETRPGVAHARNKGAEHAEGDIIVYIDDDCIADLQWLKNLMQGFSRPNVICVGGPVYPLNPEVIPNSLNIDGALGFYDRGKTSKFVEKLIGANFAIKRKAFSFTRFDVKLGRKGKLLFGLEDIDFCRSLREAGYLLLYVPDAKVYHKVDFKRLNVMYILKRAFYEGIGYQHYLSKWQKSKSKVIMSISREIIGLLLSLLKDRPFSRCYSIIIRVTALLVCLWNFG